MAERLTFPTRTGIPCWIDLEAVAPQLWGEASRAGYILEAIAAVEEERLQLCCRRKPVESGSGS